MTYALTRFQSYQDYLDNCVLADGDYRLLSTGAVIQWPPEDDDSILVSSQAGRLNQSCKKATRS